MITSTRLQRHRTSEQAAEASAVTRRPLVAGAIAVTALALMGYALSSIVASHPIGQPVPGLMNVFYHLYGHHERPFFLLLALFTPAAVLCCLARQKNAPVDVTTGHWPRLGSLYLALGVLIASYLGSQVILHGLPLSMDEVNAVFQSRIFAAGRIVAPVPVEWTELVPAVKPAFVTYKPDEQAWLSSYLPVYAAIRAMFVLAGAEAVVNPLLGALSIGAIAGVAARLWPSDRFAGAIAVLTLGTSTQFLLMSMSWYSMPAHLLVNLCWLLLYLRDGRTDVLIAPWVGVLALGLHNPFPHALFVAPFLFRMMRDRRLGRLAYSLSVYAAGSVVWLVWLRYSLAPVQDNLVAATFGLPGADDLLAQVMSLSLIVSWQTPVFALALAAAMLSWGGLSSTERDLAVGVALTCAFYAFFPHTQGHGWGYRYFYGVLGNAVLLSVSGLRMLRERTGTTSVVSLVAASVMLSIAVQLPLRLIQTERFVRPWAEADRIIGTQPFAAVVVPTPMVWYGADLIRNGPFLGELRPVSIRSDANAGELRAVHARLGSAVWVMRIDELASVGLHTGQAAGHADP